MTIVCYLGVVLGADGSSSVGNGQGSGKRSGGDGGSGDTGGDGGSSQRDSAGITGKSAGVGVQGGDGGAVAGPDEGLAVASDSGVDAAGVADSDQSGENNLVGRVKHRSVLGRLVLWQEGIVLLVLYKINNCICSTYP